MWQRQFDCYAKILEFCIKKSIVVAVSPDVLSSLLPPSGVSGTKTSFHTHPLNLVLFGDYKVCYSVTSRLTTLI